jgi:hypothetical protein
VLTTLPTQRVLAISPIRLYTNATTPAPPPTMATSGENRAAIIASLCMGRHVLPYRSAARPICADAMDEDKLSASADMAVNKGKEDSNSLSQPDSNVDVASVHAVTIISTTTRRRSGGGGRGGRSQGGGGSRCPPRTPAIPVVAATPHRTASRFMGSASSSEEHARTSSTPLYLPLAAPIWASPNTTPCAQREDRRDQQPSSSSTLVVRLVDARTADLPEPFSRPTACFAGSVHDSRWLSKCGTIQDNIAS